MKTIRPTSSYKVALPDNVCQDADPRVASFWIDGEPLILQMSSYQRLEGEPIPAEKRLTQRLDKTQSPWKVLADHLCGDPTIDQAAGEQQVDDMTWLHAYFVWPHLTVYATLIGPPEAVHDPDIWARTALRELSLATQ